MFSVLSFFKIAKAKLVLVLIGIGVFALFMIRSFFSFSIKREIKIDRLKSSLKAKKEEKKHIIKQHKFEIQQHKKLAKIEEQYKLDLIKAKRQRKENERKNTNSDNNDFTVVRF